MLKNVTRSFKVKGFLFFFFLGTLYEFVIYEYVDILGSFYGIIKFKSDFILMLKLSSASNNVTLRDVGY